MTEKEITICGHGSGTPSTKNMQEYLANRYRQKATNGKDKGLVCVVRFLKTDAQRKAFAELYNTILGRNSYNQDLRQYVYTPKNGKYYSDCSSSGCHTYDKCGIAGVKTYNTASMYTHGEKVDVEIVKGHISEKDLPKLKVGDALLFRGNDPSRPLQIGHVEYVFKVPEGAWEELPDGRWRYKKNGSYLVNAWDVINHHWYYFEEDGYMVTGILHLNGETFYLEERKGSLEGACTKTDERGNHIEWFVD